LRLRRPGELYAGFPSWGPLPGWNRDDPSSTRMGWVPDPGFLTGIAGIGLALLAATTPIDPLWDRLLAVSARPR
jgi:lantibiotic biosynthesis protein